MNLRTQHLINIAKKQDFCNHSSKTSEKSNSCTNLSYDIKSNLYISKDIDSKIYDFLLSQSQSTIINSISWLNNKINKEFIPNNYITYIALKLQNKPENIQNTFLSILKSISLNTESNNKVIINIASCL